jgi:hypothetical protein
MADAVNNRTIFDGQKFVAVRCTCRSDGTGEVDAIKISKAALIGMKGVAPTALDLVEVWWSIQGFTSVNLEWDHTTDDPIVTLAAGNGFESYENMGRITDPLSAGGTGDIILTSFGAIANATYNILMIFKKRAT